MATKELERDGKSPDVGEAAIVMAVGIVLERVSRLPEEDRADLFKLVKELGGITSKEEFAAIRTAMLEILEQESSTVAPMDFPRGKGGKLRNWIDYISKRIQSLRKSANLTQAELADRTGLPQSHISRLEAGRHSPSRSTLEKIAKALGRPVSDLDPSA